jgi:hypothetical protein
MSTAKISTEEFISIVKVITEEIITIINQSDDAKRIVDKALDIIENYVKSSKTNIDNILLLPLCSLSRSVLHIPKD